MKNGNSTQADTPTAGRTRGRRGRETAVKVVFLLGFLVVALRLVHVQVIEAPRYQEIARKQYEARVTLPGARGTIYDRSGKILASDAMYVSFGADPKMVGNDAEEIARRFSAVFGKPRSFYSAKLNTPNTHFVWLERRVPPEYSVRISAEQYDGVVQLKEPRRLYHYDHVAAQSLGFTDTDNRGLSGVELACDGQLRGVNGYVVLQRDGLGRRYPSVDYPRVDPVNGQNVVLTIDLEYQSIAEEELRRGVERNKAESGLVAMMDPTTGEILAVAHYPNINPNDIAHATKEWLKNRTVTDMFEPGSVFKIVTAAAALEHHLVKPDQKFNAENGKYVIRLRGGESRTITDMHPAAVLTFQQAIEQSSNIVMAKVSDVVGAELLYTTARNFGFGTASGVGLPGEVSGELKKPNVWSGLTLNTMAFGYEVAVTPIQLLAAYAAVANGGVLMKPFSVKAILDEQGEIASAIRPQTIRRVISKQTSETLTRFLVGAVERGTGSAAKIAGMTVAGKTGTSRKYMGGYKVGSYTASFIGFFPAESPKVVCLVMLDKPQERGYTGGLASAPIFKNIAEKVIAISERFTREPILRFRGRDQLAVPELVSLRTCDAIAMLTATKLRPETYGEGPMVLRQHPAPGTRLPRGATVKLITVQEERGVLKGYTTVPDVRRLTIRRAINLLTLHRLDTGVNGSGTVVEQFPGPGQQVKPGTRVTLRCEPKSQTVLARSEP